VDGGRRAGNLSWRLGLPGVRSNRDASSPSRLPMTSGRRPAWYVSTIPAPSGAGWLFENERNCRGIAVGARGRRALKQKGHRDGWPSGNWWPGAESNRRHADFQTPIPDFYQHSSGATYLYI